MDLASAGRQGPFVSHPVRMGKTHVLDSLEVRIPSTACDIWRAGDRLLDVGAGDGEIGRYLEYKYGLSTSAVDIVAPENNKWAGGITARAKVDTYDGANLPAPSQSFDVVMFNSVLHHAANNTPSLLREAQRVSRKWIIVLEDCNITQEAQSEKELTHAKRVSAKLARHDPNGIFRRQCDWVRLLERGGRFVVRAVGEMQPVRPSVHRQFSQWYADVWHAQRYFLAERRSHGPVASTDNGQNLAKVTKRLAEHDVREGQRYAEVGLRLGVCDGPQLPPGSCQALPTVLSRDQRRHYSIVEELWSFCRKKCRACSRCHFVSLSIVAATSCLFYQRCDTLVSRSGGRADEASTWLTGNLTAPS